MSKIIWPSAIFSHVVKVTIVATLVLLWLVIGVYKYLYLGQINTAHIISVILAYVVGCFIFDKDLPIGTVGLNYEEGKEGAQIGRFLAAIVCLGWFLYVIALL